METTRLQENVKGWGKGSDSPKTRIFLATPNRDVETIVAKSLIRRGGMGGCHQFTTTSDFLSVTLELLYMHMGR